MKNVVIGKKGGIMKAKYKMFASKMREDLYRQLKVISAVEGKQIQQLLEEAVTQYLDNRELVEKKYKSGEWRVRFSMEPKAPYGEKKEPE